MAAAVLRPIVHVVPCVQVADLLGAHRSADRLRRLRGEDLVGFEVPSHEGSQRVRMRRRNGDDQVARAVGEGGIWNFEPPLPPLFVELARLCPGDVVDVGANTGLYSLLAVAANHEVQVHAVEALPAVAALLEENLGLNPVLARRVRVHRVAVSDRQGRAMLYVPPPTGTLVETSASLDRTFKEEIATAIEVETLSLDGLWEAIGNPLVGLVKVDTEGTEHLALRGATELLDHSRPVMVCEVLPRGAMTELTKLLKESGYVDVHLRSDGLFVGRAVEFDPDAWNHAFVPREKMGTLVAAARAIGLGVRDETLE